MTIVLGRGNKRHAVIIPTGAIFRNAPEEQQKKTVSDFCKLAGIPE